MGDISLAALIRQGLFEEAAARAQAALRANPGALDVALDYGRAAIKSLDFVDAIEAAKGILLAAHAGPVERLMATRLLCVACAQLGIPHVARPFIDQIPMHQFTQPVDRCWPASLLMLIGQTEEALAGFRAALATSAPDDPGHAYIRQQIGEARLSLGDAAGFEEALEISSRACFRACHPDTPHIDRMWQGERLEGRSIAIIGHGGHGDTFQHLRYIPALRAAGAGEIVAVATPRMAALVRSAGVDRVVPPHLLDETREKADCWTGTYGLERLRLLGAPQGASGAYLSAPAGPRARAINAAIRRKAQGRPCVALYWHSDAHDGEGKSIPLPALLPLLQRQDVHWVLVQRGFALRQWQERLGDHRLNEAVSVLDEDLDFDTTAAVLARLDGMVTICAWSLHLAAALGVRCWLLAARVLSPRHENHERESVLYPGTVTLARQPTCGDWAGAVAQANADLDAWMARGRHAELAQRAANDHPAPLPR